MTIDDDSQHAEVLLMTGFWGKKGAGCLVVARSSGRFLLGRRSPFVLEPGTWGTWGGAVPEGSGIEESAIRELREETGYLGDLELVHVHTFRDASKGFVYENFLAIVEEEFSPVLNWETDRHMWVDYGEWPDPLHFGLVEMLRYAGDLRSYSLNLQAVPGMRW